MAVADHSAELARAGAGVTGRWGTIKYFARRYPLGAVGAIIFLVFVLMAVFAGVITKFDPTSTNARAALAKPGSDYFRGADVMGRDMFSRIIYGVRT